MTIGSNESVCAAHVNQIDYDHLVIIVDAGQSTTRYIVASLSTPTERW